MYSHYKARESRQRKERSLHQSNGAITIQTCNYFIQMLTYVNESSSCSLSTAFYPDRKLSAAERWDEAQGEHGFLIDVS